MATTVYMVRHGETEANLLDIIQGQMDVPLNATGIRQAEIAAERFGKMQFDVIYSSDLSRAKVTAETVCCGKPIIYTPELREWMLGHWQGKTLAEIKTEFADEYRQFASDSEDLCISGGESCRQFTLRAEKFMTMLRNTHPDKKILCVTHGGFLRAVLKNVLALTEIPAKPRTDNTALSIFRCKDGAPWQLVTWNDVSHLSECASSSGW